MFDKFLDWVEKRYWLATVITVLICVVMFVLMMASLSHAAYGATATVTWENATQNTDNTPIPPGGLVETQIEYAKCTVSGGAGQWPATIDGTKIVPFPGTTVDIANLTYGTWCFRARHKSIDGLFSDYAGPVWKQYLAPPKPPTLLTVAGIVWEMRVHPVDGPYLARVIGTVEAGKACLGMAPQIGYDIFAINPADATLTKRPNPNSTVVAQCSIAEG